MPKTSRAGVLCTASAAAVTLPAAAVAAPPAQLAGGEVHRATNILRDTSGARSWWNTGTGR